MARQNLEETAEKTLRRTDSYRVPVPIHLVAQRLSLTLEAAPLGDKVSGMLVVQGDQGSIGYNAAHARVRQRSCQGRNEREPPGRRNWEPVRDERGVVVLRGRKGSGA
jgi:hypothetical protein